MFLQYSATRKVLITYQPVCNVMSYIIFFMIWGFYDFGMQVETVGSDVLPGWDF